MLSTVIHTRDLVQMAAAAKHEEYGISAKALGEAVVGRILGDCGDEQAERAAFRAYENADDFRLGMEALGVLRHIGGTRKHARWTARLR